jgi:hypothetical protein
MQVSSLEEKNCWIANYLKKYPNPMVLSYEDPPYGLKDLSWHPHLPQKKIANILYI